MSTSPPIAASADYTSIEELLRASMAQTPIAESSDKRTRLFEFIDPVFGRFLIRQAGFCQDALSKTTSLTPAEYIFHGPNTGSALFEGKDHNNNYSNISNISILLKQPGDTLGHAIDKHGAQKTREEIVKNPNTLKNLFYTVVFMGVFNKTHLTSEGSLDLHPRNIMIDTNAALSLIDQITREDTSHNHHSKLDFKKARRSLNKLYELLYTDVGLEHDTLQEPYDSTLAILAAAEKQLTLDAQLTYLQDNLSDPNTEKWRGVEPVEYDKALEKPTFGNVTKTTAVPLNLKKATPQQLLDGLNEMADKTLAKAR